MAGDPLLFVKCPSDRFARGHQNFPRPEGDDIERVAPGFGLIGDQDNPVAMLPERFHSDIGKPSRPAHGQIAIEKAEHAHQVHAADGQIDQHDADAHPLQGFADLCGSFGVGPQTAPQQSSLGIQPEQVGALERCLAAQRPHDGDAQIGQAAGDPAFFASPHRGGRSR